MLHITRTITNSKCMICQLSIYMPRAVNMNDAACLKEVRYTDLEGTYIIPEALSPVAGVWCHHLLQPLPFSTPAASAIAASHLTASRRLQQDLCLLTLCQAEQIPAISKHTGA